MISSISSSDNKRNIILACAGGAAWGGKEVYNTLSKIKDSKETYKNLMIGFYYGHEKSFEKDLRKQNIPELEIKNRTDNYKKIRKQQIEKFKSDCRTNVQKIKKYAPFKIPAKIISGAAIGLGISYCISYINKRLQK